MNNPLGITASSPLSTDGGLREKVEALLAEDLSMVKKRLCTHCDYTEEEAENARLEFLRFIALMMLDGDAWSPSEAADEFWHEFILFTRQYVEFCFRHFERYIHHVPASEDSQAETNDAFARTAKAVAEHFGKPWRLAAVDAKCGCDGNPNCIQYIERKTAAVCDGNPNCIQYIERSAQAKCGCDGNPNCVQYIGPTQQCAQQFFGLSC